MKVIGLDFGTSSVKAGVIRNGKIEGAIVRAPYELVTDGVCAEIDPRQVTSALESVIKDLGTRLKGVDVLALDVMAPSWLAMDARGKPLTKIITHQDRRAVREATQIEERIGKDRHLALSGNRPFPGGISSTTFAWFARHQPEVLKKVDLIGHLSTFLHRQLTGARVIDPSNASFTGFYSTMTLDGWNDELCENTGVSKSLLPQVMQANKVAGQITRAAAAKFGLPMGLPMLAGIMDGSCAMLLGGARAGDVLNVSGSTDVLAVCATHPRPHEKLLTRALGIGKKWLVVSTIASAGTALNWAREQLFPELSWPAFDRLLTRLVKSNRSSTVRFEPYLSGDRMSIEQRLASFDGLSLATTREDMLKAVVESLSRASAARWPIIRSTGIPVSRKVLRTGGTQGALHRILQRDWPGKWSFHSEKEATLRGLARLVDDES